MPPRRRYERRPGTEITAVCLDLETEGFTYRKWSDEQRCKPGDWLVDNGGEIYTVDARSFAETYRQVSPGRFQKKEVWAERAEEAGSIGTREGSTAFEAGDFLVFNDEAGEDGYAMSAEKFARLYVEADAGSGRAIPE